MRVQVNTCQALGMQLSTICVSDDGDVPGTALGTENTEIDKILSLSLGSLESLRMSQVNKKEQ